MRLKSLEIKGFKSFGNPTTLHFDENVTGVVGPNGSGKSNVVDAFRWVLGEQKSKELRLEQMGDVLFNGADKKQQANLAEVSITFDNTKNLLPTEYNTVKITRALYRSGESEYRINDVACRLKDIHLLLMDTGIGSNSYSIIELGMVDDILQDKENARRRMFEQAAGISKFKKRKKETIQKLNLTNADLERIEDLLYEIEKNLKDLEKQAKRTKRYFEIKEKYKEASILLSKLKWDRLEAGVISLNQQVETHKKEYNEAVAEQAKKEALVEEEKRKNLEDEKHLSSFQKRLNDLIDEIRRSENGKNLLGQRVQFAEKFIVKAGGEIDAFEPLLKESINKRQKLREDHLLQEKVFSAEKRKLDKLQEDLEEASRKHKESKEFQEEKFEKLKNLQNQIFDFDKQIAVAQNKIDNLAKDKNNKESTIVDIRSGLEEVADHLLEAEGKANILEHEVRTLMDKEQHRTSRIEETEESIKQQAEVISKSSRNLDSLSNECDLLKSMIENMEGFSESVKFLHAKWKGKKTLLSDIINTEEQYRAAVEQVLHPYLNYFIVDHIHEARRAIDFLISAQKGKAQFFLLDQIENKVQREIQDLLPLSSVIETEEKYRPLIEAICGHVFLAQKQDLYNEKFREFYLIDENGGIFKTPQEITGGSVGLFEGKKIGRKKRIELLEKKIAKEQVNLSQERENLGRLQEELQDLKSSKFDVQIRIKEREKSDLEKDALVLKSRLDNAEQAINKLQSEIADILIGQQHAIAEINRIGKEKAILESELRRFEDETKEEGSNLEQLNQIVSSIREQYNQQNINVIQSENHLVNLKKDLSFQEQRERQLKMDLFESKKAKEKQEHELEISNGDLLLLTEKLQKLYEARTEEQNELGSAEQKYFKARAEVGEIEDGVRKIAKHINEKQFLINQLKDKLNDYKFKKNSIKERISIEFDYKISNLFEVVVDDEKSESELDLNVDKYKRRLDNYGEINPMALEAYDEMNQRFVHIREQRDDIIEAKRSLMETISEIEETATQLFLDSFNEVRKHFVTVFRSLFTKEDDCDLILIDPEDPLNSKIEIIAKPKGKRPKSLSQLSGGEKTLTATALLFSLYLLKPAPFCIFDEVDAPLDDTNIQKFANIIRAFADKSQFIIVTHNKATMAEVDVLYGVFMQKKGISSVSAVDFRNYEDKGIVATTELKTF